MSEQQHGHREHRSTETALAVISDRVHHAKGRDDISNLTLLDQSKGSVIVPHQTLLDKLSTNGIDTKWFHNYLEGRTQQVVMRRTDSTVLESTSKSNTLGVYQGGSAVWSTPEYETDLFERIKSSPSPLAGDPDPVQSGLVDQKPIQSSPIHLVRTVQIFIHCIKCIHTYIIHLLTSFMYCRKLRVYSWNVGRLCCQKSSKTLYVSWQ